MDEEIKMEYQKVADKLSEEEFLKKMEEIKQEYRDTGVDLDFMTNGDIARLVVGQYVDEKNEPLSNENSDELDKLNNLIVGNDRANVGGRVMKMTNPTPFKSKRPKSRGGELANVMLNDGTAEIRAVFWTENIKLLDEINEGDLIQLRPVTVKNGFRGGTELQLQRKTRLIKLESLPGAPEYIEPEITPIANINPGDEVNIIARITKVQGVRTYLDKNGNEEHVASMELQDASGKAQYTFWRKDTALIERLGLKEGDAIKVIGARTSERNGEINLSHPWMGRIIKGDFEVPEFETELRKIGDVGDIKDVNLIGLVTKIQDTITFQRQDGTNGYVKSIEIMDETGSIRVTLWGEDTKLPINKGDILKISGGDMEFDEYAASGYRVNTNWNTGLTINPEDIDTELEYELRQYAIQLQPLSLEQVSQIQDEGSEVDVLARIINLNDEREFQREDGTKGIVRSADISDGTEVIRISLWDDKANTILKLGDAIKIENARVKFGLYSVDLNIGKTARIIAASEEEERSLPTFETLEEMLYTSRTIDELDEDQRNVRLIARVLDVADINEFERSDGTTGKVRSMTLADATGVIQCSLWDDNAEKVFEEGTVLKIENPRITYRDELNLSIGNSTKVMDASEDEAINLPSMEELEDLVYQKKLIEDLTEDDRNVKISGEIVNPRGGRLISYRCPHCNNQVNMDVEEAICEFCGQEIGEPKPLLMLPARIVDESEVDVGVTFFGKHAEKVLDMTVDKVVQIINETGDEGALENIVEELNGREIELIADANFDEYQESISLRVKKILKILL